MKNKINTEDFRNRVNWKLNQKIFHSLETIGVFLSKYPDSKIAFSGGVDSLVLLYLVRMNDLHRKGVFVNTTNELTGIIKFVNTIPDIEIVHPEISFEKVVEKYGFPLISKKVSRQIYTCKYPTSTNENTVNIYLTGYSKDGIFHPDFKLSDKYKFLINAPFDVTDKCCECLKKKPMRSINKNGVFIGTLATESTYRKMAYLKQGCINEQTNQCSPLSIWTKQDIWQFIKNNKIKYSSVYDEGHYSTGCAYCGFGIQFDRSRFSRLKQTEPKRFAQMMKIKNKGITYEEALKYIGVNIDSFNGRMFEDFH